MNKLKKGATLLITTIALSVAVIVAGTFSSIYFRYVKMNQDFRTIDNEKIALRNNIELTYELFLTNSEVEVLGESNNKPLRTYLLSAPVTTVISISIPGFIANFLVENPEIEGTHEFLLYISKTTYKINSTITGNDELGYTLNYQNYGRLDV